MDNSNTGIKLHLGCGEKYLEGYINIDFPQDAHTVITPKADILADFRTLTYEKNTVDEIRSHHVFEHYSRAQALQLLFQWRDWLKPEGTLVIETPDFSRALLQYFFGSYKTKSEIGRHIFGSHEAGWANHYDYWDKKKYKVILKQLGFHRIHFVQRGNSISRKLNSPVFNFIGLFIPNTFFRKRKGNKLPNIIVTAHKNANILVNKEEVVRAILSQYLVGREGDEMLNVWLKEFNNK
jgi:hypothetical protein